MCSDMVSTPHWFKHKAEVVLVEEVSVEANTVELVLRVKSIQLLNNVQFLQPSLVPVNDRGNSEHTHALMTGATVNILMY